MQHAFFDVTSYISLLWGANTQERDVTAGSEKREKVTSPQDPIAQPGNLNRVTGDGYFYFNAQNLGTSNS